MSASQASIWRVEKSYIARDCLRTKRCSWRRRRSAPGQSLLRPSGSDSPAAPPVCVGRARLRERALIRWQRQPSAFRVSKSGIQETLTLSIATVSMWCSFSQAAIVCRSGVETPKERASPVFAFPGTQTRISRAPMSTLAAFGLRRVIEAKGRAAASCALGWPSLLMRVPPA